MRTHPSASRDLKEIFKPIKNKSMKFRKRKDAGGIVNRSVLKILMIMKLTTCLFLISTLGVLANLSYAQNTKLTLHFKNTPVEQVLSAIENQSEFFFLYSKKAVDVERTVDISANDETVMTILNELFRKENVHYIIKGRHIVLSARDNLWNTESLVYQQHTVSGKVTDSGGSPLPGVTVVIKGTTHGTVTNADGEYSISNFPEDAVLVFSFVGMKTQEIPVAGKASINVVMAEETVGIKEVVAIGYGTMKKVNLTGSISSVSAGELEKNPVQNPLQALQGKTPGMQIVQNSGEPGNEGYQIRIRGLNSYGSSNNPLVIIDGVAGSLDLLNPIDIESVSVLKDASSSAIYGARAANGVILITTKSGEKEPMSLTYRGNFAVHDAIMPFDFMKFDTAADFMEALNAAADNNEAVGYAAAHRKYSQAEIDQYRNNPGSNPNFDWLDYMMQSPLVMNHHLGASGGTEKARYNVSLGYYDQSGVLRGYDYNKYTGKAKFDFKINKHIEVGTNVMFGSGLREGAYLDARDTWWCTLIQRPTYEPKLSDGRWTYSAFSQEYTNKNPALSINREAAGYKDTHEYNVITSAYLRINFLKNFSWDITGAMNYDRAEVKAHQKVVPQYLYHSGEYFYNWAKFTEISLQDTWKKSVNNTVYSTLKYSILLNESHDINLIIGYNQENFKYEYLEGYRRGFSSGNLDALSAGETGEMVGTGDITDWALQSVFGRANYDYKGRYLFETSFRYDGSSRFHPDHRWGFFPSLSAGWRLSEEPFMDDISWVDNIKLRGSWGQLGNQDVGAYPYQATINIGNNYPFSGEVSQGVYYNTFNNDKISWETTEINNIGVDLSIYRGLFSVSLDVYQKNTSGIIRNMQVPSALGLSGPTINGGKMKNTGYELIVGHSKKLNEFNYQISATLSRFKNTLVDYGARHISGLYIYEEGLPYKSYYMHEFAGIFQDQEDIESSANHPYKVYPGAIKLKDQNDDGVINGDDRKVIDGAYPKFDGGLNLAFQYKNFDFSAFIYGVYGKKFYGSVLGVWPYYQFLRPVKAWENAWTPENHSNEMPLLTFDTPAAIRYNSSFYLMNTSYLRLRNLQLGYNVPDVYVEKIGLKSLRLYFSGQNLFTLHNMKFGGDPEMTSNDAWNVSYPQVKVFSLGINVKF
ncbi:SusC/RagA family TonB-linked outer membrane protein [Mariniphaga sediminis]|uniref:SusC/RagA family TonB-linked outer membrane protein n=1 Tax=Mariniphaga sediminis TaxID=1628158 RepID=A0A399D7R5_9BACT|nr:TonB-dependent receptor [Mariniphaga sediminis]RIH67118.1 SusC/RagA family TonB-linked outer membrane protein [Mariniphaga sediminis]